MTTPESPPARELARHLLEGDTAEMTEVAAAGASMHRAYARVAENLRRSVGEDGYRALLARAFARTEREQPVLKHIPRGDAAGTHLDIVSAVEGHGIVAVGTALESLVAALVEILSELIGADMVRNLLVYDDPSQAPGESRSP
jgi:hypothetical protein